MDVITGFLDGPRARGAFLLRALLAPPWSIRVEDEAPLSVVVIISGSAWIVPDEGEPLRMAAGDVALARGPGHYLFADEPSRSPQIRILPGQECVSLTGESMADVMGLGVRSWGNHAEGSTVALVGTYDADGEISRRLLDTLPPVAVVPAGLWESPILPLLEGELDREGPGQQVVLDRLLDILVVAVLRAWYAGTGNLAPSWYAAHSDPVVGIALGLLHNEIDQPWTVASLASRVGVSRAALARRFNELVGEPPMSYLTSWRLAVAADVLLDPSRTVASVARQVGYGSPFTFSTAFKRVYGHSPKAHRNPIRQVG